MTTTRVTTIDVFADRTRAIEGLAATLGWDLRRSRLVSRDAHGDSFVTGHVLDVVDAGGSPVQHTVYLDNGEPGRDGTVALRDDDGVSLSAWLYPSDPALPALAPAVYSDTVAALFERLGLPSGAVSATVVAYRPGKRAVIRAESTGGGSAFLKVVRPHRVEEVVRRHQAWAEAGIPVPRVLDWNSDGLVVLAPLPGREAIALIDDMDATALADELARVTTRIASIPSTEIARASLARRLDFYFDGMSRLAPAQTERIARLCSDIQDALAAGGTPPAGVTVHGDLHLGQLFADAALPHRLTGVVDIDTAGLGDPADDAAAVVAHLFATAALHEHRGDHGRALVARELAEQLKQRWGWPGDPGFRTRASAIAATHLLGHSLSGSLDPLDALSAAGAMLDPRPA